MIQWGIFIVALAFMSTGSVAQAVQVTVGTVVIVDGGPKDLNPAPDIVRFNSAALAKGFALPVNSSVRRIEGRVELTSKGSVVQFLPPSAQVLKLSELWATTAPKSGKQALVIKIEHSFAGPAAVIQAADLIDGRFVNFRGRTMNGSNITWFSSVNGERIQPPNPAYSWINGAGSATIVPIANAGGPMKIAAGGPTWKVEGNLIIQLAFMGHSFHLPESVEVGIAPEITAKQKKDSSLK